MAKPVHLTVRNLEDRIVLDGILAINTLKDERKIPGRIAGGMAVQGYTPSETHRGTIDVDYSLLWNGSCTSYKELCAPLVKFLNEKGYEIEFRKKGFAFEIVYKKDGTEGAFMIQHPHRSENYFKRMKHTLEREVYHQRLVSRDGISFESLSPEDLIVKKINRILTFSHSYGISIPHNHSLPDLRQNSDAIRADIVSRSGEAAPQDVALLRMLNDIYDIQCLNESVGINSRYLSEVLSEWEEVRGLEISGMMEEMHTHDA